jgi:hypothetical protein
MIQWLACHCHMMRVGVQQSRIILHDANMAMPKHQITAAKCRQITDRGSNLMLRAGITRHI